MKVLLLTHRIPYPPDKGDKIRSYRLLANLARNHEVDLVTHADDPRDLRHRGELAEMCRSVSVFPLSPLRRYLSAGAALLSGRPLSVAAMTCAAARRRVHDLITEGRPDLIVGYSAQVADYLPESLPCPVILDFVDVDSEKWAAYGAEKGICRGWLDRLEARRLADFECRAAARADRVVLTTERERALFLERVGDYPSLAISNGVAFPEEATFSDDRMPGLMVFVGTMDYLANVQAAEIGAREVLPRVREKMPQARFRIVGRNPVARVRKLSSLPGVEVTGAVQDPGSHLRQASLALFPLRVARGIQNKVLEAMANGVPIVAPKEVTACFNPAARGLIAEGSDARELARRAVSLLGDQDACDRAAATGRDFVRQHHDWVRIGQEWDRLLEEVSSRVVSVGEEV